MEAFFGLARQARNSEGTSHDIMELWTAHARKQFETLTEQTKELTALGQKTAAESAEPIARSVNQAFNESLLTRRFLETLHRLKHCVCCLSIISAPIRVHVKREFAMDANYFPERAAICLRLADVLSLNNPGRFQLMDLAEDFQRHAKELEIEICTASATPIKCQAVMQSFESVARDYCPGG